MVDSNVTGFEELIADYVDVAEAGVARRWDDECFDARVASRGAEVLGDWRDAVEHVEFPR